MAKLENYGSPKISKSLQVLVFLILFLFIATTSAYAFAKKNITEKVNEKLFDFDKLQDKEKIKEIYRECLTTKYFVDTPTLDVYGTEYVGGEDGKVWVQLLNSQKNYISNGTCLVSIYYPDGSIFKKDAFMSYHDKGIYYFDFSVPLLAGVYPVVVECFYVTTKITYVASSGAINVGTNVAGDYTRTRVDDGVRWEIQENGGRINVGLNFTNLTQPIGFTNIVWLWNGEWKSEKGDLANDYITIEVYNFTSNSWVPLSNVVNYKDGEQTITNTISTNNLTATGLVQSGTMRVRMVDRDLTDTKATKMKIDYFSVSLIGLFGGEYQEVKGSSEIHVSKGDGFYIQTLCGKTNTKENCGIFTNDDEFDELEGEIEDNITVYSISQTALNTYFTYETPNTVDCSAIYWIKHLVDGDWVDITDEVSFYSSIRKENCVIEIPLEIEPYTTEEYKIKMDNYLKWEVLWTNDLINGIRDEITERCYQINSTHNYSVPITETTYLGEGDTKFCHRSLDDLWWWDYYYNESQTKNNVGDYLSYLVEARFYKRAIFDELIKLRKIEIGDVNLTAQVNYTYFDTKFNQTWFNQQTIYSFLQDTNTTITTTQSYIINLIQNVSAQISNAWEDFWNTVNARMTS